MYDEYEDEEEEDGYYFDPVKKLWIEKETTESFTYHMSSYGPQGSPKPPVTRPENIAQLMNKQLEQKFKDENLHVEVEASERLMRWGERSAIIAGFFLSKWLGWFFLFRWIGMFFLRRAYFFAGGKIPVIGTNEGEVNQWGR